MDFFIKAIVFLLLLIVGGYQAEAQEKMLDPQEIIKKVDHRYDGDDRTSEMTMILIDKNRKERKRKLKVLTMDKGEDTWSVSFFLSPQDVNGTGFLSYDYDNTTADDQWLYLPALHKVKRIASNDKTSSFMGSDFSYADLTDKEISEYNYTYLKTEKVRGVTCYVIESIPKSKETVENFGYTKSVLFVSAESYVVIRAVYWLLENNRIKYYDVKKLQTIDDIVTPIEVHMTTKKGGTFLHKTVILYRNIRYNKDLKQTLFTTRQLEKGL